MRLLRDKSVHCATCDCERRITVDLTHGVVIKGDMPPKCLWPAVCREILKSGVFDRPFGEKAKKIA